MGSVQLDFKKVNQYLPYVLLVGVGIGTTNYIIHGGFNWIQWAILSSCTSFLIGYTLLWIASNKPFFQYRFQQTWKRYLVLSILFLFLGILATEIEALIKTIIFQNTTYQPFSSGNLYLSNSIISIFLGLSFFINDRLFSWEKKNEEEGLIVEGSDLNVEGITKVPVKQGENIKLVNTQDIAYFEAYDNYSYIYQSDSTKMLCDYSLIFLEKRLDKKFLRIHRKYIVNTSHIKQITPHLNGRYLIQFNELKLETITSSKGYLKVIKKLVKIE